ncbi:hypothetical protein NL676_030457 [Syzygium grande]|nr:hypothetical protein NL676_030457 [Syzygium grande]
MTLVTSPRSSTLARSLREVGRVANLEQISGEYVVARSRLWGLPTRRRVQGLWSKVDVAGLRLKLQMMETLQKELELLQPQKAASAQAALMA